MQFGRVEKRRLVRASHRIRFKRLPYDPHKPPARPRSAVDFKFHKNCVRFASVLGLITNVGMFKKGAT